MKHRHLLAQRFWQRSVVFDVGNARAVIGCKNIAPGQPCSFYRSLAEIHQAGLCSLFWSFQAAIIAHTVSVWDHLDDGSLRSRWETCRAFTLKSKRQMCGCWQALLEMQCETIGWHHIEAYSWQKHDP